MSARRTRLWPWVLLTLILLPLAPVVAFKWLPPPTTAFMLQSPTKPVDYQWVPMAQIAPVAGQAVIAAEDQKFPVHDGFDREAIEKAIEHNKRSKRRRGASTISQQTAKNLFLWPGGGYFRKGVEAGYTVLLEQLWGKERILEVYLNVAEFGPGLYGVEAASQRYFGKPASKLTANDAARLASVLPSPRRWSVGKPGPYVQRRVQWVLGQMGYGRRGAPSEEPEPPPELAPPEDGESALPSAEPVEVPGTEPAPLPEVPAADAPAEVPAETSPAPAESGAPVTEATPAEPASTEPVPVPVDP